MFVNQYLAGSEDPMNLASVDCVFSIWECSASIFPGPLNIKHLPAFKVALG